MSISPAEFQSLMAGDDVAKNIAWMWNRFNNQRREKIEEWKELRNYIFATDTTTTTNKVNGWKNSTTLPKLCQIRDNLHANYISALFPHDNWLKWEGRDFGDSYKEKSQLIEAYIGNKCRTGGFRNTMSQLLLDYIDYGNAFAFVDYETRLRAQPDGSAVSEFIGPRATRISPYDIVFDASADNFIDSWKIVRSIHTVGNLKARFEDNPNNYYIKTALARREIIQKNLGKFSMEDMDKAEGFLMDGFGSLQEYYQSNNVEVLEFFGDIHDADGTFMRNMHIVVIDRAAVVYKEKINNLTGHAPIYHVGWRRRPDNLWAMGPLDNLVGLQYRLDHLENLKADAMDLAVLPPLLIKGEVEEFEWMPGGPIHIDENGDLQELGKNLNGVMGAANEIEMIEHKMEMFAGAPREAMGIRTAGEKTAFEVQQLQNAAGRIFQEKITHFEIELLEPILNAMLETTVRNMNVSDVVRVTNDELAAEIFSTVTRDDLAATGILRPMGARHFATQAQMMSNLNLLFQGQLGQAIAPHLDTLALAQLVEDALGLDKYKLVRPNAMLEEQANQARFAAQAQEDMMVEQSVPVEGMS